MANLSFLKDPNAGLVDKRPWQTVQALAPLAVTSEEQAFAQDAERLADHEVDQAFAQALREAAAKAARPATGAAIELTQKVADLQAIVKTDQAKVDGLTAAAKAQSSQTSGPVADSDDLDMAKTQLQLDMDELSDATENLARVSGDNRAEIQQELAAHQAEVKKAAAANGGQTAIVSAKSHSTLYLRVKAWFDQRSREALLLQAKREADEDAAALEKEHAAIEKQATTAAAAASASLQAAANGAVAAGSSAPATTTAARPLSRAARLQQLRDLSTEHAILDDRLETQQQLSAVYAKWAAQVVRQHGIVLHLILESLAVIAFILVCAVLAGAVCQYVLDRPERVGALVAAGASGTGGALAVGTAEIAPDGQGMAVATRASDADRRRMRTLRTILDLAIEVGAGLMILLVIFGPPSQIPTILGLATAGVTVVFQDFILAFFGWFILMGKNGIRVGDWVEINSVGGEVVEIGLFRTALLETGNWTDKGHPTGRRVTFINNFAITGQYFNFSTVGQWMWDEITVNIPPGENTYKTIEAIHKRVLEETADDAHLAEDEWRRVTRQQGMSQFTATPSVDMRPAASGVDIIVRYVTRAGARFEMRNKLYGAIIDRLRAKPAELGAGSASPVEGSVKTV
jgi:hypothetical protein